MKLKIFILCFLVLFNFNSLLAKSINDSCYVNDYYFGIINECKDITSSCIEDKWKSATKRDKYLRKLLEKNYNNDKFAFYKTKEGEEYNKTDKYIQFVCSPYLRDSKFISIRSAEILVFTNNYDVSNYEEDISGKTDNIYGKYGINDKFIYILKDKYKNYDYEISNPKYESKYYNPDESKKYFSKKIKKSKLDIIAIMHIKVLENKDVKDNLYFVLDKFGDVYLTYNFKDFLEKVE